MAAAQRNRYEQHGTPPEPQRPGQKRRKRLVYAIISYTNMKKRAPILPYLLLNILVSAGTVVLVLFLWQKVFGGSLPVFSGLNRTRQPAQAAQQSQPPADTLSTPKNAELSIEAVVGVGKWDLEYILIRNQSDTAVELKDWQISGAGGKRYTFPALKLNKNGAVRLYTRSGTDSVIELFWNAPGALWKSGDEVVLFKPDGSAHSTYLIP